MVIEEGVSYWLACSTSVTAHETKTGTAGQNPPPGQLILPGPLNLLSLEVPETPSRPLSSPVSDEAAEISPYTPISSLPSMSTSAAVSAISSASLANIPLPTGPWGSMRPRHNQRRRQCASAHPETLLSEPQPQASRDVWNAYFHRQEAQGVEYDRARDPLPSCAGPSALVPQANLYRASALPSFADVHVMEVQAQRMLTHDSSSNQLVEATLPSFNFSQSTAMQMALQTLSARRQGSILWSREASPLRAQQTKRSQEPQSEYAYRCSPSPHHRQHLPKATTTTHHPCEVMLAAPGTTHLVKKHRAPKSKNKDDIKNPWVSDATTQGLKTGNEDDPMTTEGRDLSYHQFQPRLGIS